VQREEDIRLVTLCTLQRMIIVYRLKSCNAYLLRRQIVQISDYDIITYIIVLRCGKLKGTQWGLDEYTIYFCRWFSSDGAILRMRSVRLLPESRRQGVEKTGSSGRATAAAV
jgi:hypothetical protein